MKERMSCWLKHYVKGQIFFYRSRTLCLRQLLVEIKDFERSLVNPKDASDADKHPIDVASVHLHIPIRKNPCCPKYIASGV